MSAAPPAQSPRQLALALDHGESFAREDFLEGPSNTAALALITRWPDWPAATTCNHRVEGNTRPSEVDMTGISSSSVDSTRLTTIKPLAVQRHARQTASGMS